MSQKSSPRLAALTIVGVVISLLTLFFVLLLVRQQHQALADLVKMEQQSQLLQMQLLQGQIGQSYQQRLRSFVTNRKQVMEAFAARDREQLQRLAKPILNLLKKENRYVEAIFFVEPDNRAFLRVNRPEIYGDELTYLSPLVVEGNRTRQPLAGFEIVKKGLQYRLVAPVEVAGEYVGLVGFGINAANFVAQLRQIGHGHGHPDAPVSDFVVYFPQRELAKSELLTEPHRIVAASVVLTYGNAHFEDFFDQVQIDPGAVQDGVQVALHDIPHALIQGAGFFDYRGEKVAGTLALVDVGDQIFGTQKRIAQTVGLAGLLLAVVMTALYFSFGALFRRIDLLTDSLGQANCELEQRVEERTRALQRSEENLRITLDSIGDAVIATDTEGRVMRMNPIAERLTGWPLEVAEGRPLDEVFRIVDRGSRQPLANPVERVLSSGEICALEPETLLLARDEREHLIADSGAPIRNSEGGTIGVVLVFRDVTEEQALQEKLQQSQKMEAVGLLAGGVAHDFNNMLGGIMGASELLGRRLPDDPKLKKYLAMITDSATQAAELTANLLAFARKQPVSSTPVDVHVALSNTLSLLRNTLDRRVEIVSELNAANAVVIGDQSQLQNVFLNLGINASQAMPDGGQLKVVSQLVELDSRYCQSNSFDLQPGSYLEIEICDTGCGIEPENLQHIFEPFFTTKLSGKGTGLGLASVLGTIQQHKGLISVYSELGTGTVFRILLPLVEGVAPQEPVAEQLVQGNGRILVVDDEAVMRATAGAILKELGYEILVAEDAKRGLELFRQQHAQIDLVLLDMIMPEMNGSDCFMAMRAIDPAVKVILSSGFTREKDLKDLRNAGLLGFIRKPYRSALLSQAVAAALADEPGSGGLWSD